MINIISRSIVEGGINGPQKVVANLIKGLDILGYPYCINKSLDATSQLWIHDDPLAFKKASELGLKAIVGPNIYVLPRNIPENLNLSSFVYIHPSKWVTDFWKDFGFNRCKLDFWPTGIDTDEFAEREKPEDGIVLIYFKDRYEEELDFIKNVLKGKNIKYKLITYGDYTQDDYLCKLKNTRYVIWLGRQESQGIALEEAASMNIPILVWDVSNIGHWVPAKKSGEKIFTKEELEYKNTTSAYYFDDSCGLKTKDKDEIPDLLDIMEKKWKTFTPRKYILNNLSLDKQAKDLIELFDKYYNIPYEEGRVEIAKNNRRWINDKFRFKAFLYVKRLTKKCIRLLKKYKR